MCIYKHFRMSNEEFNNNEFMFHILEKTSFKEQEFFLFGGF